MGAEAGVNGVEGRAVGAAGEGFQESSNELGEELFVRHGFRAAGGGAFFVEEEDEVEIAVVVELAAAELAEGDDGPVGALVVTSAHGAAVACRAAAPLVACGQGYDGFGDVGELAGDVADRFAIEDVTAADANPFLVTKAEEDRGEVLGPFAEAGELGLNGESGQGSVNDQGIHEVVDHARVVNEDLGEELAGCAELDIEA